MPDSVTVDQGGTSITTNTTSEADLRAEMTAPPAVGAAGRRRQHAARAGHARAARARPQGPLCQDRGPDAARRGAAPARAAPPRRPTPPARRRDDTLPRHNPIARMNQALAQKAEAERRAQALEAELQRLRQPAVTSPVTPPPQNGHAQPVPGEPQFEQFADAPDPYTAYVQAWTRWDHAQQTRRRPARSGTPSRPRRRRRKSSSPASRKGASSTPITIRS